jgi:hypothetical protein
MVRKMIKHIQKYQRFDIAFWIMDCQEWDNVVTGRKFVWL